MVLIKLYFFRPKQLISLSFPIVFLTFRAKDDVDSGHLDSRGGPARARVMYCSRSQSSPTRHAEAAAAAPAAPGSLQGGRLSFSL